MNLRAYPRPKNDNGIGLHFRLELIDSENKPFISEGVQWLQQINARWTLIAGNDWNQITRAARPVFDAGIMPVCRLVCRIDKPVIDWETGVKMLHDAGIPAYMQIFNEPGDPREWNKAADIPRFGEKWAEAATRVFDAGGYPGVGAVLGEDEWQAAFSAVQAMGRMDIWDRTWFCVHNYGSNHPPTYPYDDVNQKGVAVSKQEYEREEFSMPFDELNQWRQNRMNPGATVYEDDTTVLRVLTFKRWMEKSLGYCLPMIGGEGGWQWQGEEDTRYPRNSPEHHAQWTRELFEWFRFGQLAGGTPLFDELFSCTVWIMADGQADSWWFGPLGTKQMTIDTVAAIPSFVRKFSWDQESVELASPIVIDEPTPPAPELEPPPPGDATGFVQPLSPVMPHAQTPQADNDGTAIVYIVQQGETLWGIAKKFGTTMDTIVAANDLTDRNKIRAGQRLIIPR